MAGSITIGSQDFWASDGGFGPKIKIGTSERAYAGNLRSSQRGQKRTFNFVLSPIVESDLDSLETAVSCGAHITCSGILLSNTTLMAAVEITSKLEVATTPTRWIVSGQGEEV